MLNVGYATHHADWNWKQVNSPFMRIFYIVDGEAILHLPKEDVSLKPGYMYVIPAHTMHSYECHGVFKLYYMHIYEGTGYKTSDIYAAPDKIADWIITRYDSTKKLSHTETLCDINDFIDELMAGQGL